MADIAELVKVMQEQMQLQQEQRQLQRKQMQTQDEHHKQQLVIMQQQMEDTRKAGGTMAPQHQTPPFPAFDSIAELWKDYLLRFETFVNANSVPDEKKALVFLTNQTSGTYKLITNYASQQDVPTTANMSWSSVTLLALCQVTTTRRSSLWGNVTSSGAPSRGSLERRRRNWQLGSDRWQPHATSPPSRIHWTRKCGPAWSAPSTMKPSWSPCSVRKKIS